MDMQRFPDAGGLEKHMESGLIWWHQVLKLQPLHRAADSRTVTGTSFSVPFVTGSAALLMEWGIVRGNDPFLYGEKVRAYLQRGARPLPGFEVYPNEMVGYGEDVIIRLH